MIEPENRVSSAIERWLQTLGIQCLAEWDVLIYLYRHQTSLVNAEQISHLLDHGTHTIADALNALESLGLVERSRARRGVRLHRLIAPADPLCQEAFERLLTLDDLRPVRWFLTRRRQSENSEYDSRDDGGG